jgi:hypothetical protein
LEGTRTAKRYVLFIADGPLAEADRKEFAAYVERRVGKAKVIPVAGNPRAMIVKTTNEFVGILRSPRRPLGVGGREISAVLTSGAIVNLKKRASEAATNGKVP